MYKKIPKTKMFFGVFFQDFQQPLNLSRKSDKMAFRGCDILRQLFRECK